jgi:hypothetical protein
MNNQTIKINKRTKQEYPVSIRCAWPELVTQGRRGKVRGSRSKLLGNRELEARVIVLPPKRNQNKIAKIRKEIAENRAKRNRLAVVIKNPTIKAGAIKGDGTIQPRIGGRFLPKIKVA